MPRINENTNYLRWQLTDEPYQKNLMAERMMKRTVSISASTNGVGIIIELTPEQAREFAATIVELADITEAAATVENANVTEPVSRNQSTE